LPLCKRNIRHNHFSDERHRDSPATAHTDCMESQSSHSPCPRHLPLHGDLTNTLILQAILPWWQNKSASKPFLSLLAATALRKVYRPDVIREADVLIRLRIVVWLSCLFLSAAVSLPLFSKSHRRGRFFGRRKQVNERNGEYLPRLGNANSNSNKSLLFW
jgi:hypothetical protein